MDLDVGPNELSFRLDVAKPPPLDFVASCDQQCVAMGSHDLYGSLDEAQVARRLIRRRCRVA